MQDSPDKTTLLGALSVFLLQNVRPAVTDPALRFRLLVAANLTRMIGAEIFTEDAHDALELAGLQALLGDGAVGEKGEGAHQIADANRELAARIRDGRIEEAELAAVTEHCRAVIEGKLVVINPSFDRRARFEG